MFHSLLDFLSTLLKNKPFHFREFITYTGYRQMKLTLTRLDTTDHGIFGHLVCDGDTFNCVTLENDEKEIPNGTYKVTLFDSPRFGYKVPLLHDVPGRDMIEIHPGNLETDSKGCILVGMKRTGFAVENSKSAFNSLMAVLEGCTDVQITIK